jgi:hypothetical protein
MSALVPEIPAADGFDEAANIFTAAGDGDLARVAELVASGVSVNAQDDFGYTALHAACSYRNVEIAKWLIEHGADVRAVDEDGDTALTACEDPACADLLLAAGADLFAANKEGHVAYQVAVWEVRDEMVEWHRAQYARMGIELPDASPLDEDEDEDFGGEEEEGEGEDEGAAGGDEDDGRMEQPAAEGAGGGAA